MKGGGVRILGGELRGRRLRLTKGVRPTEAKVRGALFDIWQGRLLGCRFLDLFAGSGAVGLEAVSRGAAASVLVEGAPRTASLLRRACDELAGARARVVGRRLPASWDPSDPPYDLIFADPPYDYSEYGELTIWAAARLAADGELAVEHSSRVSFTAAPELEVLEPRRYGETVLSFFRLAAAGGARDERRM